MLIPLNAFRRSLLTWFDRHRRDLPWRRAMGADTTEKLDPYAVLVSEAMLQQTQVATVIPYFKRWMAKFPTIESLAGADEQEVLKEWEGLGYYSRARNLHKAAQAVIGQHKGSFPHTVEGLRELPGVGPYTAGAVASIAFDVQAPIVDGNVIRVLSRVYGVTDDPRTPAGMRWMWERAGEVVPKARPGDFNSALMELGATICAPKNPQCLLCPVAAACVAREKGLQNAIPPAKKTKETPHFERVVFCLRRADGRYLLEQRPATGRWAGMWQFVTRDAERPGEFPVGVEGCEEIGEVSHALTHRRYTFRVVAGNAPADAGTGGDRPTAWVGLGELGKYPLPKPQVKVVGMLSGREG